MMMKYQDYIFFKLNDGSILNITHANYVDLVQGFTTMPEFAGLKLQIADLYVSIKNDKPDRIVNCTYSFLNFDQYGHADPHFEGNSIEDNKAFYDAVFNSEYSNINNDPAIQKVRIHIGDEFSWIPTEAEIKKMYAQIFQCLKI
jgi:hypothetical protein